jgi:hypothetical protein
LLHFRERIQLLNLLLQARGHLVEGFGKLRQDVIATLNQSLVELSSRYRLSG